MVYKKYQQLDNKQWLLTERQQKSRRQIEMETGIPAGSIQFAERGFSLEIKKTFKFERVHNPELQS
jgi:hypothetical protein